MRWWVVPTLSSPLRFPSDKTKGASTIAGLLPRGVKKVCSPFFGGGSVELAIASKGIQVDAYSDYYLLCEFWNCLIENPLILVSMIKHYYPMKDQKLFHYIQENLSTPRDAFMRAAQFYVLNRCSEGGEVSSGRLVRNHPKFTPFGMKKLLLFEVDNFAVGYSGSYKETISQHADAFLLCCPPKFESFYGGLQTGTNIPERPKIDHEELCSILTQKNNWILSYNYHPKLLTMYTDVPYKLFKSNFRPAQDADSAKEIVFIKN